MRGWGITFLILGIGSFILPLMGMQFSLLSLFGQYVSVVAGILIVLGLVMVVFGGGGGNNNEQ
ncbi:MAG: hypothetical protein H7Z37_08415 [Pyrinomonadaceae bacterium]|nr:hypothetical protein [Pyrinomonadaceae bacterium]